jgi:hypothetical protein
MCFDKPRMTNLVAVEIGLLKFFLCSLKIPVEAGMIYNIYNLESLGSTLKYSHPGLFAGR